jgi:hypothetical protein
MVRVFELFSNFSFASFLSYARVCIPHSGYVRAAPQHFSSHDSLSFYRFGQDLYILEQQYPLHAVKCSIVPSFICHPHFFVTISFHHLLPSFYLHQFFILLAAIVLVT